MLVEGLQAGQLGRRVGHFEDAALVDVRLDALLGGDPDDLVDRLVHRLLGTDRRFVGMPSLAYRSRPAMPL